MTILSNNEVVLVASGKQTPTTNQMIREQIGEAWYEYVPLGKFVVSAPEVCRGRPTFKYTRIEVAGVLERLGAGHAIEDLIADSQGVLPKKRSLKPLASPLKRSLDRFLHGPARHDCSG